MATYKMHCMYCENLIPGDSNICPFCAKESPFCMRCPKCKKEVEKGHKLCSNCGFSLQLTCPNCGKTVFPAMMCPECGKKLLTTCPKKSCAELQPASNKQCIQCGRELN